MYLQVLVSFKDYFNGTIYNIKEMVGGLWIFSCDYGGRWLFYFQYWHYKRVGLFNDIVPISKYILTGKLRNNLRTQIIVIFSNSGLLGCDAVQWCGRIPTRFGGPYNLHLHGEVSGAWKRTQI
jgi:hypothetical protein